MRVSKATDEEKPLLGDENSTEETQHIILKNSFEDSRQPQYRQFLTSRKFLGFLLAGAAIIATPFVTTKIWHSRGGDDDDDDVAKISDDDGGLYEVYSDGSLRECLDYDDDTTFTSSVCSKYDWSQCYLVPVRSCNSSFWCRELCGSDCEAGTGALCYFSVLSDLDTTCAKVKSLLDAGVRSEELSIALPPSRPEIKGAIATQNDVESAYGLHDDESDKGCFVHSFCEFCTGTCRTAMLTYVETQFNATGSWHVVTAGASVERFKDAVMNIEATCRHFGYDV